MMFDDAFAELLKHEGGFSDHKADPGKATRYGITEAVAREVRYRGNMQDLPIDLAKRIYLEQYWNPIQAEKLPPKVRYAVFDAAVNSGVTQSIKWLQRAAGTLDDGIIGPKTLEKVNSIDQELLLRTILSVRLKFMTDLKTWQAFSRGWARRIADIMVV